MTKHLLTAFFVGAPFLIAGCIITNEKPTNTAPTAPAASGTATTTATSTATAAPTTTATGTSTAPTPAAVPKKGFKKTNNQQFEPPPADPVDADAGAGTDTDGG